jgi:hypothetical protein
MGGLPEMKGGFKNEQQQRITSRVGQICRRVHGSGNGLRIGTYRMGWSNDANRLDGINSLIARGGKLLGSVGVKMKPAYRVLAESDRASAEEVLEGAAGFIEIEALEYVTGSQVEIRESQGISQLVREFLRVWQKRTLQELVVMTPLESPRAKAAKCDSKTEENNCLRR